MSESYSCTSRPAGMSMSDDVVVDRAEVSQHFAELVDLLVLLRDEVEQVGIEARGATRRDAPGPRARRPTMAICLLCRRQSLASASRIRSSQFTSRG